MPFNTYWSSLYKKTYNKKFPILLQFDKQLKVYSWAAYIKKSKSSTQR